MFRRPRSGHKRNTPIGQFAAALRAEMTVGLVVVVTGRTAHECQRFSSISSPPALSVHQSLCWHERRCALVLDQDHDEFRRLGLAGVPVNDMNIVGALIEGL